MKIDIFGLRSRRSRFSLRLRITMSIVVFCIVSAFMLYDTFHVQTFISERALSTIFALSAMGSTTSIIASGTFFSPQTG